MKQLGFKVVCSALLVVELAIAFPAPGKTIDASTFGVKPDTGGDVSAGVQRAVAAALRTPGAVLVFRKGRYNFYPEKAAQRHYLITNHDVSDQRAVAFALEGAKDLILDGGGSVFVFHGAMLPVAVTAANNVTLRNFSIDFARQHLIQTTVIRVADGNVEVQVEPHSQYKIVDGHIHILGEQWDKTATASLEFDKENGGLARGAHDNYKFDRTTAEEISRGILRLHAMPQMPQAGNILVIRNNDRPNPAIWVDRSENVQVQHVTVYYAQGMAFVAQKSANLHLDDFNVLQRPGSGRYVTTDADAVHCAACKGQVVVENGTYENMLDDGINIHGSYMRVKTKIAADTVLLEWVHAQAFGYEFSAPGEHVQFVKARTLLPCGELVVKSSTRPDEHHEQITFTSALPDGLIAGDAADNIDWQPTVIYRNNTVRRNRARGAIFKTPRGVLVEGNTFDHLSGAAILFAADAASWYESAPAQNVVIRGNHFIDPNIANFGFAPISFRPNIDIAALGKSYNVRHIQIEGNDFNVFQRPLIEGWSVDGLTFKHNRVRFNTDYTPTLNTAAKFIQLKHVRCLDLGPNDIEPPIATADTELQDASLIRSEGAEPESWSTCGSPQ